MISITCTSCQAALSIDDAFAGGVCRCQFCGAIQTVPSKNARPVRATSPHVGAVAGAVSGSGQKTLYSKKGPPAGSGTGLNDLAEVVASSGLSGLSGSGLTAGHNRKPVAGAAPANKQLVPILIGAGVIIVALVAVLIWMATRNHTPAPQNGSTGQGPSTGDVTVVTPPSFLGTPLNEQVIVYVLDRGQASKATLDYTKLAFLKSLGTLRSDQKFQVIFWKTQGPLTFFPAAGPAEASPDQIEVCRKVLDDVSAYGSSEVKPALEKAMQARPDVIVIATGKPLDDSFVKTVLEVRKNSKVKVDCISLDDATLAGPMQQVATKTGGTYRNVEKAELVNASH